MHTESTDVCVIGGGPSGTAAAIGLAQAGLDVVLVERLAFPRHRPGESLHPGVEPLLSQLGVAEEIQQAGFRRFGGITTDWNPDTPRDYQHFASSPDKEWMGYQVERSTFDEILLRRAACLGTRILQPARVRSVTAHEQAYHVVTSDGNWNCRWIVDASGQSCALSRCFDLAWRLHSDPLFARYGYVEAAGSSADFDVPSIQRDKTGWTWLAPITGDRLAWVRVQAEDVGPHFVPDECSHLPSVGAARGADVTWRIRSQVAGPRWFLCGDSAMVLDPSSSHGVLKAMLSGTCAASMVVQCIDRELDPQLVSRAYSRWLQDGFLADVQRLRSLYNGPFTERNSFHSSLN
ncbi:MAG: NAD(P)/FAD-dependent oxidoreductase [Fuerstiella sp.]